MVESDFVPYAVDLARKNGCEYSEARFQRSFDITCFLRNGQPEPAAVSDAEGIGVRVVYNGALAFGATNLVSKESVSDLVSRLVKNARQASDGLKEKVKFSREEATLKTGEWTKKRNWKTSKPNP